MQFTRKTMGRIALFLGVMTMLSCSAAPEKDINLDELATNAGTAQGAFVKGLRSHTELSDDELDAWAKQHEPTSAVQYFDDFYQYGMKHPDTNKGFQSLILALTVSGDGKAPAKQLRAIHDRLYETYRDTTQYTHVLRNLRNGRSVGYGKREDVDPTENDRAREERVIFLLDRVSKTTKNAVVLNHVRMYLGDYLLRTLDQMDEKDLAAITKRSERARALFQAAIENTKDEPMPIFSSNGIDILQRYRTARRSAERPDDYVDPPQNNQRETPFIHELSAKFLFKLNHLTVGKMLPPTIGADLTGSAQALSQYKGRVLLIDLWATWCGPCIEKFPHFRELKQQYKASPFEILGISGDDEVADITEFLEDNDLPWDLWFAGREGGILSDWSTYALPTVFLVDHTGTIVSKNPSDEKIEALLPALIRAAEQAAK